jgi:succinylglutamate desuccinylase
MIKGFTNFQIIQEGQLLAKDKNGSIFSPMSGYLLMPLYQAKGEDGFFIAEELVDSDQGSGTNSILTELTQ